MMIQSIQKLLVFFSDGQRVTSVRWNMTAYISRSISKSELIDLLGADNAEEVYEYNKKVRSEIESAVRAVANAVYGPGTSQANQLYNEIINSTSGGRSF